MFRSVLDLVKHAVLLQKEKTCQIRDTYIPDGRDKTKTRKGNRWDANHIILYCAHRSRKIQTLALYLLDASTAWQSYIYLGG